VVTIPIILIQPAPAKYAWAETDGILPVHLKVYVSSGNLESDSMQLCTIDALRSLTVRSMCCQAIPSSRCLVHESAPMCSPRVLCYARLNKLLLIPSTSAVHPTQIQYRKGGLVGEKSIRPRFHALRCASRWLSIPEALRSACMELQPFQVHGNRLSISPMNSEA